jgi:hypothetical protein
VIATEGRMKNRNGIEVVPPPRPKRDCINPTTGRRKRTFYSQMAAEQYLATVRREVREAVRIYQCSGGHFHFTRLARKGKDLIGKDHAAVALRGGDGQVDHSLDSEIDEQEH